MSTSSIPQFQLMQPDRWAGKTYVRSWVAAAATADITDKASGETIGTVADANAADIAMACKQASAVAPAWAALAPSERARIVRRAGDVAATRKAIGSNWAHGAGGPWLGRRGDR